MTTKDKEILVRLFFAILFFLIYIKLLAYAYNRWIWGTGISDHFAYILILFVVLPASNFSGKRASKFFITTNG